eukprot:175154-Rhodomonas_salina.1
MPTQALPDPKQRLLFSESADVQTRTPKPPVTPDPFPDLTDGSAIQAYWTVPNLQDMLKAVNERSDGNKTALAARLMAHSAAQQYSWEKGRILSEAYAETFTDLQVAHYLQQKAIALPPDPQKCSSKFMKAVSGSVAEYKRKRGSGSARQKAADLARQRKGDLGDDSTSDSEDEPGQQHLSGGDDEASGDSDTGRDCSLAAKNEELCRQIKALKKQQKSRRDFEELPSSKGKTSAAAKGVGHRHVDTSDDDDIDGGSIEDSDDEEVELSQPSKRQHQSEPSLLTAFKDMATCISSSIQDGFSAMGDASSSASTNAAFNRQHPAM